MSTEPKSTKEPANNLSRAKSLWSQLGDISINENEEIESKFLHFEAGTFIYDIWYWFEDEFDLSVAQDLMNQKESVFTAWGLAH